MTASVLIFSIEQLGTWWYDCWGGRKEEEIIKHNGEEIPQELWYLKLGREERGDRKDQKATAKSLEEKSRRNFFKKARNSFQSKDQQCKCCLKIKLDKTQSFIDMKVTGKCGKMSFGSVVH